MPARKTGLASFTGRRPTETQGHDDVPEDMRTKAKGDTVAITLRLTPDQWERVHGVLHFSQAATNGGLWLA